MGLEYVCDECGDRKPARMSNDGRHKAIYPPSGWTVRRGYPNGPYVLCDRGSCRAVLERQMNAVLDEE